MNKLSKMQVRLKTSKEDREPLGAPNNVWDELNTQHAALTSGAKEIVARVVYSIAYITQDESRKRHVKDEPALSKLIDILNRDITEHLLRLDSIKAKHSNMTGGLSKKDSQDVYMLTLSLSMNYIEAQEIFDKLCVPTIKQIEEMLVAVRNSIQQEQIESQQAKDVLDINVITDVVAKEVNNV